MRVAASWALALVCLVSSPGGAWQSPLSDADAVRQIVRRYVAAREARDPKAVAVLFTADADQLVSSGEWRLGREAVVTGSLASSAQSGGTREIVVERVRLVSKDVAIADGRYSILGADGGDRRMWTTFMMVKGGAGWQIAGIRNMLPAPPVAAATLRGEGAIR